MTLKRLKTFVSLFALLAGALCGCTPPAPQVARHAGPDLTPMQYQFLKDRDKVRYKDVIIRVPESWGGVLLPFDRGPYASPVEKAVHSGDLNTLMGLYNQSLFELEHPRVKIEYLNFDMWSDNFRSALAVAIASHRAPSYYIARDLPQTIEQGMYADLTPLMKKWDQFKLQPEGTIRESTMNGHIYCLAGNELSASIVRYRKDWFREAGIFNEHGEPGPPSNWTWEDFRRIAKKLTDPARGRYGYAGEMGDFLYNQAHVVDLYIPDPTGRHTWIFNDKDPDLIRSLQAARDMVNLDKSVDTSVSFGWTEWHNVFDASHAGMILSWAAHPPRESLEQPDKFGKDKPFSETVGMAVLPHGPGGISGLAAATNPIGFDPTLSPEQLQAAFDWCKSWFYGDVFENRLREEATEARIKHQKSVLYAELLCLPYQPRINVLDVPLDRVFPPDYLRVYKQIREAHAVPLPREFGLSEPAASEMTSATKAMYSEAITSSIDLKSLVEKTARIVNTTMLDFGGKKDRDALRRYIAARTAFYQRYYPAFASGPWKQKLPLYYRVP